MRTPSALSATKHVISSHSNSTLHLLTKVVRNRTPNYNYMGKALIQFYSQSWPESTGATACAHAKSSVLPATKHVISSHSNSTLHLLTKVVRNRTPNYTAHLLFGLTVKVPLKLTWPTGCARQVSAGR